MTTPPSSRALASPPEYARREDARAVVVPRTDRPLELLLLGTGLVACTVALMPDWGISFDRVTYPKEFVLVTTSLAAALVTAIRAPALQMDRIDGFLLALLGWSTVSAANGLNSWWALRGLGVLVSGAALFWVARSLRNRGFGGQLTGLVALAVTVAAATGLLEAYGVLPDLSKDRSPGGTLGTRNGLAHQLVLGLPLFLVYAFRARRKTLVVGTHLAFAGIAAALLLSRTRTAWLAVMVMGAVVAGVLVTRPALRKLFPASRAVGLAAVALIGVLAAWQLPNVLVWSSASPYADTAKGIVDYQSGSGKGRLVQYSTTARMIKDHPVLGVGPGHWAVYYLQYARPGDPNLRSDSMVNRLHNGEWLGVAAEFGVPGLLFLALAGCGMLQMAWRNIRRDGAGEREVEALALLAALPAIGVLGLFDSKLQGPAGIFLLGTLVGTLAPHESSGATLALTPARRRVWVLLVGLALLPGVMQSSRQLLGASLYRSPTPANLSLATRLYPGDFRGHIRLAYAMVEQNRCDLAFSHFGSALVLYPTAPVPSWLSEKCPGYGRQGRN